jgi:beta-phosphoglucomutase-like phosphatase (HAD superfamily)
MDPLVGFVFDMDGVIVDSNPFHKIALKQFCKAHGFDLTEEQLREKIYGRTNRDWILSLFGRLPDEVINRYALEKEALFRKLYEDDIKPLDGLIAFLNKLNEGDYLRAVGTSAPYENVEFTLIKTSTQDYFPIVLHDTDVVIGKPDPEIYLKTAATLKIPPDQCIVFEDSLAGIKSAATAGCKVVALTTTHSPEEMQQADLIIDNFIDLDPKNLISQLF